MGSLQLVDLFDANDQPIEGLVSVRHPASAETPHEYAILLQAATFKHADSAPPWIDYVLFRRFKDSEGNHVRSSQVAAYVVDNSQHRLTQEQLGMLHHQLWLHGTAPLIYVAWPTRVDILTCAREPDFWEVHANKGIARYRSAAQIGPPPEQTPLSNRGKAALKTAARLEEKLGRVRRRFSGYRLVEGTFWDEPENQQLANEEAAAHRSLIQAIVEADRDLGGGGRPVLRRLLVLLVLIKYLEDRGVFPQKLFGRFHKGAKSSFDLLRGGTVEEVLKLLRYLEAKFNGDVFSLADADHPPTAADLKRLARLIEAKELAGQRHFWDLFSFKHIPVEVISRLYQRFVTGHGAVYTPSFTASLLLDQVMPYDKLSGTETVLDPACGSGVFLVGAFKRLVISWRAQNGWRRPTVDELKRILAHSIHGVELESGAIDLTAFSLALAICDSLEPPVIWSSLKLEKLRGRNLREGDFFDSKILTNSADHEWPNSFDVVIGNPPFESRLTPAGKTVDERRSTSRPSLPDYQAAYLFLEDGLRSLAPGGALCLIQPHGILYNSKTVDFRKYLMKLCPLHAILDFVSMRGMYEGADTKTIAWHAVQKQATNPTVKHLVFRRTFAAAEKIAFEIDHYDWHVVSREDAMEDPFLWRVDLLGGGRLHALSQRFRRMRTLAAYLADKGPGWDYGEGFIAGKKGKLVPAPFLTGQPLLPTSAFTENGIDRTRLDPERITVKETLFKSPYTESRYTPPLVLLKAHDTLPVEFWDEGFLAYRDKIIGIHAPETEKPALQTLFEAIRANRRFYQFCLSLNGTQAWTGKATVPLKQDIDLLPFPDDPGELGLAFWEDALKEDLLNHMAKYLRLGQDSHLLRRAATNSDLQEYASLYVRMLGSLYRNLKAHGPIFLNGLVAQPFFFGPQPDVSWLHDNCAESLHALIYEKTSESLRTVRVVRYYEGNVILIVKPDRLRYWISSTAIRDADDTLIDLREQGW